MSTTLCHAEDPASKLNLISRLVIFSAATLVVRRCAQGGRQPLRNSRDGSAELGPALDMELDRDRGQPLPGIHRRIAGGANQDASLTVAGALETAHRRELADEITARLHAMFGFEKPSWYYLPHFGAVAEATRSLPEARRRFRDGELPLGGQLTVRYKVPDDGLRWARVESWTRDDLTIVRETTGRELSPAIRPATPIPVETARIVDWAVWLDGEGVVEGAGTECVGWLAGGVGDRAQSAEAWLAAYGGSLQSR
jgi:hypothetical protein